MPTSNNTMLGRSHFSGICASERHKQGSRLGGQLDQTSTGDGTEAIRSGAGCNLKMAWVCHSVDSLSKSLSRNHWRSTFWWTPERSGLGPRLEAEAVGDDVAQGPRAPRRVQAHQDVAGVQVRVHHVVHQQHLHEEQHVMRARV